MSYALTMSRWDREPTSSGKRIRRSSIIEVPAGPVMRYGPMHRQRVMKELRRGQPLAPEDMPVAAALGNSSDHDKDGLCSSGSCCRSVPFPKASVTTDSCGGPSSD